MDLSAERWVEVDPEFQVKVEFVNGNVAERGPFRAVSKQTAGNHRLEDVSGSPTVQQYWADEGVAIREDEAVVSISSLTFPASRVYVRPKTLPGVDDDAAQAIKDNGLDRLDRLLAAAQSDLAAIQPISRALAALIKSHVRDIADIAGSQSSVSTTGGGPECEYCGDPAGDTPIEDSTSRTYCSIGCLNDDHLDA